MIALSVAADGHQRRPVAASSGAIAGPDPWKANTLEWFTPSPPPENNFDVIPRVRSVEPMKDIRREIEQRTGVDQRYRVRQADGQRVDGSLARRPLAGRARRRPPGRRRLRHADQAEGAAAAAPDDDHDDVRRRRPVGRRSSRSRVLGGFLSAGGAGAVNHYYDRDIDAAMARTANRPVPSGRISPRAALIYGFALQVAVVRAARDRRERAGRVPRPGRVPRYVVRLHDLAQAPLAAEHRHRRRRGRRPAAGRLGGGDRQRSTRPRCTCSRSSSTGRRRTSGRCRC